MTPNARDPDRGTSLILAVVFVFIVGIVLVAVGGLAANAMLNTSNVRAQRTSSADAETAITIAMRYFRYTYVPSSPPPASCLLANATIPSSDPRLDTHNPVQVQCTENVFPTSTQTRVVDFYACASSVLATNCVAGNAAVLLHAHVTYDDLNAQGFDECYWDALTSRVVTTSCGIGMSYTWDVTGADN